MVLVAMMPERPLDSATVEACYQEHKEILEKYAWAILRDWSLAFDAVQNGFVSLAKFGGDVAPEARKAWLFRVIHREAIRLRGQEFRYRSGSDGSQVVRENLAGYETSPLDKLEKKEELIALAKQIDALPHDQKEVLKLRIFEEKSFAEIAEQMNVPLGTALSRMRLALERLRLKANGKDK